MNLKYTTGAILSILILFACEQKRQEVKPQKLVEQNIAIQDVLPEGYPPSLVLHDGLSAKDFRMGEGIVDDKSFGERSYKSYNIEQINPKMRGDVVKHYKQLLADDGWDGKWTLTEDGRNGKATFTKDNMELLIKINDALFCLKLKVYDCN